MFRGWTKASAYRLQITIYCAVLCHIVSLQYLSRSSLHRLGGLPCRIFLSYNNNNNNNIFILYSAKSMYSSKRFTIKRCDIASLKLIRNVWSPSGDTWGPSVVFEAVDRPCPGQFHFSYSIDYIYDFCPLPNPDVGLSTFVRDDEHRGPTSFHFGMCCRKFVLCLFGQCPGLCTIYHSWQHTGVVNMSLQADSKVAFEDIPVFGICRPACHESSLYLFVLVLFLEAAVLSQVHVTFDILFRHIVHV